MRRLLAAAALAAALAAPSRASLGSFAPEAPDLSIRMERPSPDRGIVRQGPMTICTDGVIKDPARARVIRKRDRNHRQKTALTAGGGPLDPDVVPYFVLPRGFSQAQLGDLALVTFNGRSAWAVAGDRGPCEGCAIGRKRHKRPYAFGEGSIALARALGVPGADDGDGGGAPSGVSYLIFPGTAPEDAFASEAALLAFIADEGAGLFARRFAPPRPLRLVLGR